GFRTSESVLNSSLSKLNHFLWSTGRLGSWMKPINLDSTPFVGMFSSTPSGSITAVIGPRLVDGTMERAAEAGSEGVVTSGWRTLVRVNKYNSRIRASSARAHFHQLDSRPAGSIAWPYRTGR